MRRIGHIAAAALLMAAAPGNDPFERTLGALAKGSEAAANGELGALRDAARALRASGAMPVVGEADLAARWQERARGAVLPHERDRALGPGYRTLALPGGGTAEFDQTFLAGQRARVAVVPAGRSAFTMRVTGDGQQAVCEATPGRMRCDWVPDYTMRFRIAVHNSSRQAGKYFLVLE